MNKFRFESANITAENIVKIAEMFPGVVTEGKVNFELLRSLLGDEVYGDEAYEFTWVGKRAAIAEAGRPIRKTLRPVMEDETIPTGADSTGKPYCSSGSKNWDTTENLYIEGDNLDVLKLLQESYLGKVKMIYIDPPYNTGNDFIYRDDFTKSREEYDEEAGVYDKDGDRLFRNTESNGRFHSDWCSMMYPRLVLARNLLRNDGVIFISIDDNEVVPLRAICDEVFGEVNRLIPFIWQLPRGINAGHIARAHEYILVYAKNALLLPHFSPLSVDVEYSIERCNKKIDSRHPESTIDFPAGIRYEGSDKTLEGTLEGSEKVTIIGKMHFKNGVLSEPVTLSAGWTMKNMILDWLSGKEVYDSKGQKIVEFFFKENGKLYSKKEMTTYSIKSVLKDIPDTQIARKEMDALFGSEDIFPYPKTLHLPALFAKLVAADNDIILDFFSGSATTAHAVMQLNAEDGGKRKFIMVQLPEPCAEGSEAAKAGYKNICEIGKERIRRAGEKIKEENKDKEGIENLDIGFRVLKLDDTNMKDVYYAASEYTQDLLSMMEDNIKDDRTDMDLLYACLLDWGLPLSMPHTQEKIGSFTVHTYNDGDLIACFEKHISDEVVKEIARRQPLRAVFRDSSFASSPEKINVEEIFKLLAPNTSVRVI